MKNTFLFLFAALAWSATALCQTPADSAARPRKRVFIAHRGVNMRSTVAGENSLEAIRLAKAAGFGAIETDVRLSADGALVVMHDSTLNRTCLHADGTPLSEPVAVAGKTLRELRSDYILKAADTARRTRIPTLEEYLAECARNGLYTFIEPKLYDPTGRHYRDIVAAADAALGRDRYVVTSNNRANDVIRRTGIDDVRLMGILYQTTFERIEALGDVIVAVSATRFDEADYSRQVARAKAAGLMCESHADKFVHFDRINRHDIDFVSTDFLAPDYRGQGRLLAEYARADGFVLPASADEGAIRLGEGQSIVPKRQGPPRPLRPRRQRSRRLRRRTLRRPLPGTGSRRQRPHRAGRPNLHARRPRQAHRHAPSAAPRRRTRPAHHGARRRDHPHGDTGEGRSVRTITPHPARKQEERSIPPNYARGPADRRASFAGTKYYRP